MKDASLDLEEWRPLVGWERRYEVSNMGRIRALDGRIIRQHPNSCGYMVARLSQPRAMVRAHRAVAEAFVDNPCGKPLVNHIDSQRANNVAANLEWCTQAENLAHARRLGRMPDNYWRGKRSPNAKLSNESVALIRLSYSEGGVSHSMLATRFMVSKRCIGRILAGEIYRDVQPLPPAPPTGETA